MSWGKSLDRWLTTPPEPKSHPCRICQFDVYSNSDLCEDCKNKEENKMENLREELCSRYGLYPEQVSFDIRLRGIDKDLAEQIGKDYGNEYSSHNYHVGEHCTTVDNKNFKMYIHYPVKDEEDE